MKKIYFLTYLGERWRLLVRRMARFSAKRLAKIFLLLALLPASGFAQSNFYQDLADAAHTLTRQRVIYDPSYYRIGYPNGDVPEGRGVCTDVVIRAYRKVGIDLQQAVHEDMQKHFSRYPSKWGLKTTDRNIDHRRVPNLMVFFSRHGATLELSADPRDYLSGNVVAWDLGRGVTHIGLVSDQKTSDGLRPLIVHNIGFGQVLEDVLFKFKIIGHYRYGQKS